jgi:pimeloyl-ACP methyl ester carboxylesterase
VILLLVVVLLRCGWRWGALFLVAAICLRLYTGARGESLTMVGSDGGSARLVARIVDEGELAVPGSLLMARWLRDPEASRVPGALDEAYREMRAAEGAAPSPVLPTYLGLQSSQRFDVVVIEPRQQPRGALIFLHGFAGNFALQCWMVAQPDLVTFCPSVGWRGDWWTANGARTLDKTLALVHRRGFSQVYLAGLSNGGAGAARLAAHRGFRGLILISGTAREAPPPGIPVLVVQGRRDQMMGADLARSYAARTHAEYLELDGGHFALLLERPRARAAIADWLRRH